LRGHENAEAEWRKKQNTPLGYRGAGNELNAVNGSSLEKLNEKT